MTRPESIDERLDGLYDTFAWSQRPDDTLAEHREWSRQVRARRGPEILAYGAHPREIAEVYPSRSVGPMIVLIHGGYWRRSGIEDVSFLAEPLVAAGACVVSLDYPLAPEAQLDRIVESVRNGYRWATDRAVRIGGDPARVRVVGHSAGAHLGASLISPSPEYPAPDRLVGMSGLYDLRPLPSTMANEWLRLDERGARALSPALHVPEGVRTRVRLAVGASESPGFLGQTADYAGALTARGVDASITHIPGADHFTAWSRTFEGDLLDFCLI